MTAGTAFLLILWIGSHLLILLTVQDSKARLPIFMVIGFSLLVIYVAKPYTYDLKKYSIFFHTGFMEAHGWHTPKDRFTLDRLDITGEPFSSGFEKGFMSLSRIGHRVFPSGDLVPRFDAIVVGSHESGIPHSDAMVFLIMVLGFGALYIGARQITAGQDNSPGKSDKRVAIFFSVLPGALFFMLGSQNTLRQFLGLAIVILAVSFLSSRRYVFCFALLLLSATFHKWAPVFGLIIILLVAIGEVVRSNGFLQEIRPVRLSLVDALSLLLGIIAVFMIKGLTVLGSFDLGVPLIIDLKPYLIEEVRHASAERWNILIKAGLLFAVFMGSEIVLGRTFVSDNVDIRLLRRMVFAFTIPLVIYSEIFARVVVLYWAVETIFMVWALASNNTRARLAGAIVFVSYGFAPNGLNVLIGPNGLYSL